jgi:hypothetical protein
MDLMVLMLPRISIMSSNHSKEVGVEKINHCRQGWWRWMTVKTMTRGPPLHLLQYLHCHHHAQTAQWLGMQL